LILTHALLRRALYGSYVCNNAATFVRRSADPWASPMFDLNAFTFVAVLASGGTAISSASPRAQEPQDLFLRCSVVETCYNPPSVIAAGHGLTCGYSTELRSYRVSFRQRTISELSGGQLTYLINTLTSSLIKAERRNGLDSLDINRITGEFNDFHTPTDARDENTAALFGKGKCEKAPPIERRKF
jgi:hypothetical protein